MNPRNTAWGILCRVFLEGAYANIVMRDLDPSLSKEDKALISQLVYGTLRNRDYLQVQWKDLVQGKVRPKTAILLNMSAYQLLFMDRIPSYAVIHEAVELAPRRAKGFVNAVLRKLSEQAPVEPQGDVLEQAAIKTSHPLFLLKLWSAQYGEETALRIAAHDQKPSRIYGRLNSLKTTRRLLEAQGVQFLEGDCFTWDGNLVTSYWLKEGMIVIQDRASQKIVPLLDVKEGMRVMDVCAAPGTKTQQIACAMNNTGMIDAFDLYPERVNLIESLMKKTGVTIVHAQASDATSPKPFLSEETYDRILIDAPCSGLGDLSHKPEIRYHITPQSLDEIVTLQKTILETNAPYLRRGGKLVYSTCTLNRKENEGQIRSFLERHFEFKLLNECTVFPFEEDSDGFYMACLEKSL